MNQSAKRIAENATFQAFVNSYVREVQGGHWTEKEEWIKGKRSSVLISDQYILELYLKQQSISLAISVNYHSLVGRHEFGVSLKYCEEDKEWYQEDRLTIMVTLIQELHLMAKSNGCPEFVSHFDELIFRLIESYQTMANYIENRMEDEKNIHLEKSTFIETEQSLLFGHWFHPTPKSRQGMANWQHERFAPELQGSFQLHYFQVDQTIVQESSVLRKSTSELIYQSLWKSCPELEMEEGYCFIPMHPLQAQWLLQQQYVKQGIEEGLIEDLGLMGPFYTATSSLRTVYSEEEEWMYKFSIPVKVTNSLRVNRNHELKAGVVMAELMEKLTFIGEGNYFQIIDDPAYITVNFPGQLESGFEVIIRSNVFQKDQDKGVSSIAAIVQDPLPNEKSRLYKLISTIAQSESRSLEEISFSWFENYWKCAVEPLIRLYDEHGIALEAHQQNSVLDVSSGYPEIYYYRDNQGYYLSKLYEDTLCVIEPSLFKTPELFYEDSLIQERFTYYLFMNQLFSVIHRFGSDNLLEEEQLIEWCVKQLYVLEKDLTGSGKTFVNMILKREKLAYKANLLTRFHDVDELNAELEQAVYTYIKNPFVVCHKEEQYATATSGLL
ncbi:IucA/IucC family protein [Metabacillus fastidiosus]|uniref:IucA/IucC family protein n=1 Tax=Metabacillus fastidiosus TaxID=1458 RepID=UPI003D282DF0